MTEKLRINFVMPPSGSISGGPLAILEYANRLAEKGHGVSVTTFPNSTWPGEDPYPWFKLKGDIIYARDRVPHPSTIDLVQNSGDVKSIMAQIFKGAGTDGTANAVLQSVGYLPESRDPFAFMFRDAMIWLKLMEVMPECDLNIATFWSTAFPVYFSRKGKPVYFMQHFEEVFYDSDPNWAMHKLLAAASYRLPIYKVANSSWLRDQIKTRHGQEVPFSNNGMEIADFYPRPKMSVGDGIIRIVTYSRPEQWKGFADAVAAMSPILKKYGDRVSWQVFGYQHPTLGENNFAAPYAYHPKLSFAKLSELYATSDIVLCPSWYESFPLPPLEGMASGTAVITTRLGTEDYAFDRDNSLVVGARDIRAMTSALEELIENPKLREQLARSGRRMAETYGWGDAVEKREKILLDIHNGKVDYDILASYNTNLQDRFGIDFERGPTAAGREGIAIYWDNEHLNIYSSGVRYHIMNIEIAGEALARGARYVSLDLLEMERMPRGVPLASVAELERIGLPRQVKTF